MGLTYVDSFTIDVRPSNGLDSGDLPFMVISQKIDLILTINPSSQNSEMKDLKN